MAVRRRLKRTRRGRRPLLTRLVLLGLVLSGVAAAGYLASQGQPSWRWPGGNDESTVLWATVTTDVLNVRESPTTDSAVLASFVEGETVQVVGEPEAGFVPVAFGGGRAWMARDYLSYDDAGRPLAVNPLPVREVAAAPVVDDPVESEVAAPDPPPPAAEPVLPPPPESHAPEPAGPDEPVERWIDVNRTTATVTLYEGSEAIVSFAGKVGRDPSVDGFYSTAVGTFHVYSMNKGLAPTPFADDAWLTDWVGFDPDRKNGIHSPVRDANGVEKTWQNPTTLGCVRLNAAAAEAVFAFAEIGMRVEVHD